MTKYINQIHKGEAYTYNKLFFRSNIFNPDNKYINLKNLIKIYVFEGNKILPFLKTINIKSLIDSQTKAIEILNSMLITNKTDKLFEYLINNIDKQYLPDSAHQIWGRLLSNTVSNKLLKSTEVILKLGIDSSIKINDENSTAFHIACGYNRNKDKEIQKLGSVFIQLLSKYTSVEKPLMTLQTKSGILPYQAGETIFSCSSYREIDKLLAAFYKWNLTGKEQFSSEMAKLYKEQSLKSIHHVTHIIILVLSHDLDHPFISIHDINKEILKFTNKHTIKTLTEAHCKFFLNFYWEVQKFYESKKDFDKAEKYSDRAIALYDEYHQDYHNFTVEILDLYKQRAHLIACIAEFDINRAEALIKKLPVEQFPKKELDSLYILLIKYYVTTQELEKAQKLTIKLQDSELNELIEILKLVSSSKLNMATPSIVTKYCLGSDFESLDPSKNIYKLKSIIAKSVTTHLNINRTSHVFINELIAIFQNFTESEIDKSKPYKIDAMLMFLIKHKRFTEAAEILKRNNDEYYKLYKNSDCDLKNYRLFVIYTETGNTEKSSVFEQEIRASRLPEQIRRVNDIKLLHLLEDGNYATAKVFLETHKQNISNYSIYSSFVNKQLEVITQTTSQSDTSSSSSLSSVMPHVSPMSTVVPELTLIQLKAYLEKHKEFPFSASPRLIHDYFQLTKKELLSEQQLSSTSQPQWKIGEETYTTDNVIKMKEGVYGVLSNNVRLDYSQTVKIAKAMDAGHFVYLSWCTKLIVRGCDMRPLSYSYCIDKSGNILLIFGKVVNHKEFKKLKQLNQDKSLKMKAFYTGNTIEDETEDNNYPVLEDEDENNPLLISSDGVTEIATTSPDVIPTGSKEGKINVGDNFPSLYRPELPSKEKEKLQSKGVGDTEEITTDIELSGLAAMTNGLFWYHGENDLD